ncbi:hypothetical protein N7495_000369 [Penicillium taxi]|uniref:uncharacterized protein n=1 Tax=Penicillium taxi TaxID=168475 RepID=UPI00254513A3|nr:uncharacterized protein N7495_000369 [Penicillium taxi]KAJ5907687.1 hypothetical protein N7495_000369 [Penicillium taxi]
MEPKVGNCLPMQTKQTPKFVIVVYAFTTPIIRWNQARAPITVMTTPRPAHPKPLGWLAPSHLTVFIRNLKLLQLDQREDWPDITLRSLSPSLQNQRQRIRLVEWALYYLFTIYDPEGAQSKLRPFFPPLESLQSVNLRAALFRVLADLKKNGDLGREAILRKSMLDDCKGEKFDELLAIFSTAVLRKLVAVSTSDIVRNPAMSMATATEITPTDYQNMVPLILTHQVSLNAVGTRRACVQTTYDEFSQLLDSKKSELTVRENMVSGHHNDYNEASTAERLAGELRTNWLGSEEWATALLNGGSQSSTDKFLELPFSRALARAKESTVDALGGGAKEDLVIDLEARVLRLRSRLRRWHEFNDSIRKERDNSGISEERKPQEPRLRFRDHQSLTVASISKAVRQSAERGKVLRDADQSFLASVHDAISQINGTTRVRAGHDVHIEAPKAKSIPLPATTPESPPSPAISIPEIPKIPSLPDDPQKLSPIPAAAPNPSIPEFLLSPGQDFEEDKQTDPEPEPIKPTTSSNSSIVERTRKSMSLLPPPSSYEAQARPRRRGPRPSFPTNQFETPRKLSGPLERSGASTPHDKLFEEDAEYSSVFKSRPRVALSPISSPAVHVSLSDESEDFELDQDNSEWDVDSPLAAPRFRA